MILFFPGGCHVYPNLDEVPDICACYGGSSDYRSGTEDQTRCIDQKAPLMSDTKELFPDWVTGLEGETVTCKDVTIKLSTFPFWMGV
jgi:hypothetical protein